MTKPEMDGNGNPAAVHLVLQGKGGVGKSFVSAILAQYFRTKSATVHCLDTDPVNATFAQHRLLEAEHLKVLRLGTINEKQFDLFAERVCQGDGVFIVDTGATTFVPLWNYILENVLQFPRAESVRPLGGDGRAGHDRHSQRLGAPGANHFREECRGLAE